ncbi:MAG: HEPN domain-containing protein [Spirochaetaceae bacterium]
MTARQQERRFDPEYGRTLLDIAEKDFTTARFAESGVPSGEVRPENLLFLYQQAIEKLLKAVLCRLEVPVPLVHDLGVLPAKLPENVQPGVGYEINRLNEFAGVRHYEEGGILYEPEDLDDARTLTEELLAWARRIMAGA